MSFKVITPESIPPTTFRDPRIRFSKSGTITINRSAAWLMRLEKGDRVVFARDEKNPEDWYLAKHDEGFPLGGQQNGELSIYNKHLKAEIDKQFGPGSYSFGVSRNQKEGHDGQLMWLLITADRRRELHEQQLRRLRREPELLANDCQI